MRDSFAWAIREKRENKKEKKMKQKERDADRVSERRHFVNAFNEEQVILARCR